MLEGVKKVVPRLLLRTELRSPPELIYLHRALTGTYTMLRRLGYSQNLGALVKPYVDHANAVAEGRVDDGSPVCLDGVQEVIPPATQKTSPSL